MKTNFIRENKILKNGFKFFLYVFSVVGVVLTTGFFAVKLGITNDPGTVDRNDRYLADIADDNYSYLNEAEKGKDSLFIANKKSAYILYKIGIINNFYPKNAQQLLNAYIISKNAGLVERMINALSIYFKDNEKLISELKRAQILLNEKPKQVNENAIAWMNVPEWEIFKEACIKDKKYIDSAAKATGVEARLITSMLVGEQIRLFHTSREWYKSALAPLKILAVETKFSLGVTGIKLETAQKAERFLKDPSSPFYLGKEFENIIQYSEPDSANILFKRLTEPEDHYYSYLYAAIIIKQIQTQWKNAGYDLSNRQDIVATLFNLGYEVSQPKADPKVGGSSIILNEIVYTFGSIAFDFYYSGELVEEFPFRVSL